jgi:hypothetical protein
VAVEGSPDNSVSFVGNSRQIFPLVCKLAFFQAIKINANIYFLKILNFKF